MIALLCSSYWCGVCPVRYCHALKSNTRLERLRPCCSSCQRCRVRYIYIAYWMYHLQEYHRSPVITLLNDSNEIRQTLSKLSKQRITQTENAGCRSQQSRVPSQYKPLQLITCWVLKAAMKSLWLHQLGLKIESVIYSKSKARIKWALLSLAANSTARCTIHCAAMSRHCPTPRDCS